MSDLVIYLSALVEAWLHRTIFPWLSWAQAQRQCHTQLCLYSVLLGNTAGPWLQISPPLANLPGIGLNPLSQGLSPSCLCYWYYYSCFLFLGGVVVVVVFSFSLVLSFPKDVCHQALLRSALLHGPDTNKHLSPSPNSGSSPACATSLSAASVVRTGLLLCYDWELEVHFWTQWQGMRESLPHGACWSSSASSVQACSLHPHLSPVP